MKNLLSLFLLSISLLLFSCGKDKTNIDPETTQPSVTTPTNTATTTTGVSSGTTSVATSTDSSVTTMTQDNVDNTTDTTSTTITNGGNAFEIDSPIILAYFPSWSENWVSSGQSSKLRDIPSFVNHVFLAFAKPNLRYEKGSFDLAGTGIEVPYDGCELKESIDALRLKGINVILSVGGETFWRDAASYEINYQQIKDLVDDIGFAGIDWDFEPDGSFQQIGNEINTNRFITFFTESRKLMPKSEGYLLACAPAGVGALGGQFNDDLDSPFQYVNRNSLTGETDALLFQGTVETNGINLFGFSSTGHMIPVIKAVGDKIDLIAFQGYNTGASTNRKIMYDAYAYYAAQYGFVIAAGVHYPPEPWGPYYTYTHENVADLGEHIYSHTNRNGRNDGIMIWQLLLEGASSSSYSYLNAASKALSGIPKATAAEQATDFSLEPYSGGGSGCTIGTGTPASSLCGIAVYNSANQYPNPGTQVVYNCQIWENKWWINPNEIPGTNEGWEAKGACTEGTGCDAG